GLQVRQPRRGARRGPRPAGPVRARRRRSRQARGPGSAVTALRSAVRAATGSLAEAGVPSPEVDAVELAAHVLGIEPSEVRRQMVVGGVLPTGFEAAYAAVLAERVRRVPLQHLTGRAHFRTLTLHVGPGVFVPRPETEVLVDLAVAEVDRLSGSRPGGIRLVDLCAGSG